MNNTVKRNIRIGGITIGVLIVLLGIAIGIAVNFIFTPKKLTPVVVNMVNKQMNAKLDMNSVELTFFSTFPRFGLKLTDGTLISKALRDTLWNRTDTLLKFKKVVLVFNPIDYLKKKKISIQRLVLDSPNIYAHKTQNGKTNWNILAATEATDTTHNTPEDTTHAYVNGIAIHHVILRHATVTYDDREARTFANLWDANVRLKAYWHKGHSMMKLDWSNKNILYWQDGKQILNRLGTNMEADVELNRATHTLSLNNARIRINNVELDMQGKLRRDSTERAINVDLTYGLHAPSLQTVLHMIPPSILKPEEMTAKGAVKIDGTLKGWYGRHRFPLATLSVKIDKASARYKDLPYGVDEVSVSFFGQVDLSKTKPSFANLKIFRFRGVHTDIQAEAKVDNLLDDPDITIHTISTADLTALAQTLPLQKGVSMGGKLTADMKLHCRLSSLKKQDIGRIQAEGKLCMEGLFLRDTNKGFDFTSDASFAFMGKDVLGAKAEVTDMHLLSARLNARMKGLTATVISTNPQDTTRITRMMCRLNMNSLKASMPADSLHAYCGIATANIELKPSSRNPQKPHISLSLQADTLAGQMGDSLRAFCGRAKGTASLQPGHQNTDKPQLGLSLEADTLFCRLGSTRMSMDKAGIAVKADKMHDSIWIPKGIVGFNRLAIRTPLCALPIRIQKTSVTVGNRTIALRNATLRIGRSDLTASGAIHDLYGAMRHHKILRANLSLSSNNLNCNQLIRSLSFPTDTIQAETDTTATDLSLFVIPHNIDFELTTNLRRVRYGKMLFEKVHGAVDIRNQAIHLKSLSMKGLGATMKTSLLYRARQRETGYAGFDFRLHDVNIGHLVDFVPALDSIVPMLRSFQGTVNFNIAAEADLDSCLRIQIPSLRSAIHVEGDSLVLMDGETFAEISKKFLFKNKERNLIDSIAVNISVQDGNVTVYPFVVQMDRYRAAVGGTQDLAMNFDYHISILKSPIPFKLGLNIRGNLDKMKFGLGKAKYKNAVTPVEIHKVDSTIANMGQHIVTDFRRIMERGHNSGKP